MAIRAIYEGGVFRPIEPVDLPEHSEVEIVPKPKPKKGPVTEIPFSDKPEWTPGKAAIHAILGERDNSGETDAAESWMSGVSREWADDWNDPRENIYTLDDGKPVDGPR